MKQNLLCLLLMMCIATFGWAGEVWVTLPNGGSIGFYTEGHNAWVYSAHNTSSVVTIPSTISVDDVTYETYNVVGVGPYAFENNTTITKVILSEGITYVEADAFNGCTNLMNITLPSTLTRIGTEAFRGCRFSKVTIPDGVTAIGGNAFCGCGRLREVHLPSQLTEIGMAAFNQCSQLDSIDFPPTLTTIGGYAFMCTMLREVSIPDNVTTIGESAFALCDSLKSVTIGKGVTTIGNHAFAGCSQIHQVVFNAVNCSRMGSSVEMRPFGDYEPMNGDYIDLNSAMDVVIGGEVAVIPAYAFARCRAISRIELPASVTTIGEKAFYGCQGIDTIISHNPVPPAATSSCFTGVDKSIPVEVPYPSSAEAYGQAGGWREFANIQSYGLEGIADGLATNVEVIGGKGSILVKEADGMKVRVSDISGRQVFSQQANGVEYRIQNLRAGVYLVRIGGHPAKKVVVMR